MILEIVFSSVTLLIMAILIVMSIGYPPTARLFPLIVIIPTTILLTMELIKAIHPKRGKVAVYKAEISDMKTPVPLNLRAPIWIGSFLLSIYILGYLVGIVLFSLLYLKINGEKWSTSIIYVVGIIALLYGCFELGLDTQLYEGLLFR